MPRKDRSLGRSPSRRKWQEKNTTTSAPKDEVASKKNNMSVKKNMKERVLFLPALDGSVKGACASYLRQHFHYVHIVNLKSSMYNVLHENCYIKRLFTSTECISYLIVLCFSLLLWSWGYSYVPGFILFPSSFFLWRDWPHIVSRTWYQMVTTCIHTAQEDINDFRPTVVAGARFGGAVAIFCLLEKRYVKPTVLLAPMHGFLNRAMVFDWHGGRTLPDNAKLVIAHGTKDARVKLEDSQKLAQDKTRCKLHVIENENHRLRSLVGQYNKGNSNATLKVESTLSLVALIEEAIAMRS